MSGQLPDGTGGPHAFVEDLDAPVLSDDDHHHLARVRRIREGAPMTIGDGRGGWRNATFAVEPEPLSDWHASFQATHAMFPWLVACDQPILHILPVPVAKVLHGR